MKTAIEKAIEDIEGYRSFSNVIEIGFVCALLRNVYMGEEKALIIDAFKYGVTEGTLTNINYLKCESEADHYYNETYKQDK